MEEQKRLDNGAQEAEEMEIDLMELARKLWIERKLIFKVCAVGAVLGVIFALGMTRTYSVNVTLAPESGKSGGGGALSGITSMLGMGNLNLGSEADALNITLFPEMASSTPFLLDLLDTRVKTMDGEIDTTLTVYLEEQKKSLGGMIMSLPGKAIGGVMSLFKDEEEADSTLEYVYNPFLLTKKQDKKLLALRKDITAMVDKKTGITTVSVTMQDPMVAAIVADTVVAKLQEYVTEYRVSKALQDCEYLEMLYKERQKEYYAVQQKYAEYEDANKNVILQSVLVERERLQNETSLAMQVYSQVAQQLQVARAKVQEAKPVFAVVQPACVPLKPSGTSRAMMVIAFIFLSFAGTAAWVLFGKDFWTKFRTELKSAE